MKYFVYLDALLPVVLKPVLLLPHAPSHVKTGPRDGTFGSKKTRTARSGFSANAFLVPRRYGSGVTSHIASKSYLSSPLSITLNPSLFVSFMCMLLGFILCSFTAEYF